MRLAFFGRGQMGRAVQARPRDSGFEVGAVFASDEVASPAELARRLAGHDAAIDFSAAPAVLRHVEASVRARVPLVEGTTGWSAEEPAARRLVQEGGGALLVGANFSIGVHLFYRIVDRAAELFRGLPYDAFIEEAHHAKKRDAPSGTALELARLLAARLGHGVPVSSTRAGHIPGVHRVGFDGAADQLLLVHSARSRDGFADGALAAARWLCGRSGFYTFGDVLDEILDGERRAP